MQAFPKESSEVASFLAHAGHGCRIVRLKAKDILFSQGSTCESVYYLQEGRVRLSVVSAMGKEAIITFLSDGDFVGEESVAEIPGLRLATAAAICACTAVKIERKEMIRALQDEHAFSDQFITFLLARNMRTQADLIDQLFNSSEKRLARILLLMAEFGQPGEEVTLIPKISQASLADMVGTTRSRVSFFMNRFRKMGFISYKGRIQVHKSLLNVILTDQPNEAQHSSLEPKGVKVCIAPRAKAPRAKAPRAKAPRAKAPRAKAPRAKAH